MDFWRLKVQEKPTERNLPKAYIKNKTCHTGQDGLREKILSSMVEENEEDNAKAVEIKSITLKTGSRIME